MQNLLTKPICKFDYFENLRITENDFSSQTGKIKITHNGAKDGNYAILGERINLVVSIPRALFINSITLEILTDTNINLLSVPGKLKDFDNYYDYFEFTVNSSAIGIGLFFYYFKLESFVTFYSGKNTNGKFGFFTSQPNYDSFFQLTVCKNKNNASLKKPEIIYHIFVDRFAKGGNVTQRENSRMIEDWSGELDEYPKYPGAYLKNNTFYGGNLYGITEKLDYLLSLGISIIYLSPVFESPSNHKYDTSDYENVDLGFGGNVALSLLIKEAEKKGIDVILDGVFNHTGADSIYFNKFGSYSSLGAYQSTKSPYYSWYKFKKHPGEYESWWGIDILPKIHYEGSDAEEYFLGEGGVVEKWMQYGIKGFRLDVADELSDEFIERMRALLEKFDREAILYGEVWEDASNKIAYGKRKRYYLGSELTGVMNYPLRTGIINYIRTKESHDLRYALDTVLLNMPKFIRDKTMNLLGSHDTERIITAIGGEAAVGKTNDELLQIRIPKEDYKNAKMRVMSAYTIISLLPGIPSVYYGDEAGMEGYSDPFNRRTYPWGKEDEELLAHYRKIGEIRKDNDLFADADFELLFLDNKILAFQRKKGRMHIILVYNNSDRQLNLSFSAPVTDMYTSFKSKTFVLESEKAYIFLSNNKNEMEIGC